MHNEVGTCAEILPKEVRGFEAICACHFAVKYLKYTIKFLR